MSVSGLGGEFSLVQNPVAESGGGADIYSSIWGSDSRNLLMLKLCNTLKAITYLRNTCLLACRRTDGTSITCFLNAHILCITPWVHFHKKRKDITSVSEMKPLNQADGRPSCSLIEGWSVKGNHGTPICGKSVVQWDQWAVRTHPLINQNLCKGLGGLLSTLLDAFIAKMVIFVISP